VILPGTLTKKDPGMIDQEATFPHDENPIKLFITDALNQETTYGYNEICQQVSQTNANNHTTRLEYDQFGRL